MDNLYSTPVVETSGVESDPAAEAIGRLLADEPSMVALARLVEGMTDAQRARFGRYIEKRKHDDGETENIGNGADSDSGSA